MTCYVIYLIKGNYKNIVHYNYKILLGIIIKYSTNFRVLINVVFSLYPVIINLDI